MTCVGGNVLHLQIRLPQKRISHEDVCRVLVGESLCSTRGRDQDFAVFARAAFWRFLRAFKWRRRFIRIRRCLLLLRAMFAFLGEVILMGE